MNNDQPRQIATREMHIHPAELAGAIENFRDEQIDGKIVGAQYPTEDSENIRLTWATTEDIETDE